MGSTPQTIFSASQISGLLGLNPYVTKFHAYQKAMETLYPGFNAKKGWVLPPFPDSAPIRWGLGFESAIIKLAEEKEGCEISWREELFKRKFGNVEFSCHIDGAIGGTKNGKFDVLHEGKSTWSRAFYSKKGEDCEVELELDGVTGTYVKKEYHRRWGEPGTAGVPQEYQIQAAIQRICTGADLVKLSVLVFPKSTDEFEKLGWKIRNDVEQYGNEGEYLITRSTETENKFIKPYVWARTFDQIGNFHTYKLPRDEALESAIIKATQEFNENYILPQKPPKFEDYQDVRRFLTDPYGTIKATAELETKLRALSVAKHQVSAKGPHMKLIETLKVACSQIIADAIPDDASPSSKIEIVSATDGKILATMAKSGFRVKKGLS